MKVQSTLYDKVSGSIGKITGQQGRGGSYLKTKSNPRNPSTPRQVAIRGYLSAANVAWRGGTVAQREAWQEYAATVTYENNTGATVTLTGWNAYSRIFVLRAQASIETATLITARPANDGYESSALVDYAADDTTASTLVITNESTAPVIISVFKGKRSNATVNSYTGSFQFQENVTIAAGAEAPIVNMLVSGRNWFRIQTLGSDGRAGKGFVEFLDQA